MSEYTYKCKTAKATADRIWVADFYLDSSNDLVVSADPDTTVATVGLSGGSGAAQRLRTVTTLYNYPWSQEIVEILFQNILAYEDPLPEWSIDYKSSQWTVTMAWPN